MYYLPHANARDVSAFFPREPFDGVGGISACAEQVDHRTRVVHLVEDRLHLWRKTKRIKNQKARHAERPIYLSIQISEYQVSYMTVSYITEDVAKGNDEGLSM